MADIFYHPAMARKRRPQSLPLAAPKAAEGKSAHRSSSQTGGASTTDGRTALAKFFRAFITPELDKCIKTAERARADSDALLNRIIKAAVPDTAQESPKQHLCYEAPSKQFWRSTPHFLDQVLNPLMGIPPEPAPKAMLKSAHERISELLEILWADIQLWKLVAKYKPPEDIAADIHRRYGLKFPPLPVAAWRQMAWSPQKRELLFNRLRIGFSSKFDDIAFRELRQKLPPTLAGDLLFEYLYEPGSDHLNVLASQKLSPPTLAYLRRAVAKLLNNISWCQRNPGLIPPRLAPAPRHRAKTVERARKIEEMVNRLLDNPALSDYELAGDVDAFRKVAAEARQLVELREGEAVKRYSEQRDGRVIGRKPRRTRKIRPSR